MNPVLESAKYIQKHAKHVIIDEAALERALPLFDPKKLRHPSPTSEIKHLNIESQIGFTFAAGAMNFYFWGEPKWGIEVNGKRLGGSYSMRWCLLRALDEEPGLLAPKTLEHLTEGDVDHIFRAKTDIPMIPERAYRWNELGRVVRHRFGDSFSAVVRMAKGDALSFVDIMTENFPSWDDRALYNGTPVRFNKLAQILAYDLFGEFGGKGPGRFGNIGELTAFADYKLPQGLRKLGILQYSNSLKEKIKSKTELETGSQEEIEIRGMTVLAVHLLAKKAGTVPPKIDYGIWLATQTHTPGDEPYHRTRTHFY